MEPKDWLTLGVSVAALVVSVVALTQKGRYFPRPLIECVLWLNQTSQTDQFELTRRIANRGNGDASDVAVYLRHADEKTAMLRLDHVDALSAHTVLQQARTVVPLDLARDYRILITWRQSPNNRRVRKKQFKLDRRYLDAPGPAVPRGF